MNARVLALLALVAACGGDDQAADPADAMPGDGAPGYRVGGQVICVRGSGLVLSFAGTELPISQSGSFEFPMTLADGAPYAVTIVSEPSSPPQECVVDRAEGAIAGESVTDVVVRCSGAPATRVAYQTHDNQTGSVWLATLDEFDCPGLEPISVGPPGVLSSSRVAFVADDSRLVFNGAIVANQSRVAVVDLTAQDLQSVYLGPENVGSFELSLDVARLFGWHREAAWTGYYAFIADLSPWPPVVHPASGELWGGIGPERPMWSSDAGAVVFAAALSETGPVAALFIDVSGPGPYATIELNPPLASNRDVEQVVIAPDATRAAYVADQDVDETQEVFLVELEPAPGIPVKVSPLVPAGSYAWVVGFTPDSNALVFTTHDPGFQDGDLYWLDLSGPLGAPVQIEVSDVDHVKVSPDGRWVAYWASHAVSGLELFVVDISGAVPGAPVRISPEDARNAGNSIEFSSDGRWIVFPGDQNGFGAGPNAFAVDISGSVPSAPYPISPTLADEFIGPILLAPDGSRALCTYAEFQGPARLSVVDLSGLVPGPPIEVPTEGGVIRAAFTRDGDALLFTTRDRSDVENLFVVHLEDEVLDPVQVNSPFGSQDMIVGPFDSMPLP